MEDEPNKEYERKDCEEECGEVEEELLLELVEVECLLVSAVFGRFLIDFRHFVRRGNGELFAVLMYVWCGVK